MRAVVHNPAVAPDQLRGFIEANGYVSMEAGHFSRAVRAGGVVWGSIEDLGAPATA